MSTQHQRSRALKALLVFCCIRHAWGHQLDTYINNHHNSTLPSASPTIATRKRITSSIYQEESDKPRAITPTLVPEIIKTNSQENLDGKSVQNTITTSRTVIPIYTLPTALPLHITHTAPPFITTAYMPLHRTITALPLDTTPTLRHIIQGELNGLHTKDNIESSAIHKTHTLKTTYTTPVNNIADTEIINVSRANRSITERLPRFPARRREHRDHSEKDSEYELVNTEAPIGREEHRGHQNEKTEGVSGREAEAGRRKNLCATCLCDAQEHNVYCKHEHLYNGESHRLRLTRALLPPAALTLHVQGFERVVVMPGTFAADNLTLRNIKFQDIGEVELYNGSLRFSPMAPENLEVVVEFNGCHIPELPTTTLAQYARSHDQHTDINLERTRFLSLHIERCNITIIRTNALYQARLLYFTMIQTKVKEMETHAIHIDIYEDWTVEHCHLPFMIPQTICLRTQRVVIFSHNIIEGLTNRSLNITSHSQVLFEYNYVSHLGSWALLGIQPYGDGRGANIVFLNNTVAYAENASLVTSRLYPIHERKIIDNRFDLPCNCHIQKIFGQLLGIAEEGERDYYEQVTLDSVLAKSRCQRFPGLASYSRVEDYIEMACTNLPVPIIASVVAVAIAIIITVIVSIVCVCRAQKAKEEANYLGECCYSHSFSTLNSHPTSLSPAPLSHSWERSGPAMQPWVIAVPEVKTYQETELHMDYEHTEPFNSSVRGSFLHEPGPILDLNRKNQMRASCPFN